MKSIVVTQAQVADLASIAPLLDAYRVFYGKQSNLPAASHFLFERMINHESVIYWTEINAQAAGFAQLYPGFSSVSLLPVWTLNDLYVSEKFRQQGVATFLINACQAMVSERQDHGLILSTALMNGSARKLYEKSGFQLDCEFVHYEWRRPISIPGGI